MNNHVVTIEEKEIDVELNMFIAWICFVVNIKGFSKFVYSSTQGGKGP